MTVYLLFIILSLSTFIIILTQDVDLLINNDNDIVTTTTNKIVTTVTCYYKIDNNHYTENDYLSWIENFMKIVSYVVIYVDDISYQV